MSQVLSLTNYRRKTRKTYLAKYGSRLDLFLKQFIAHHISVDFRQMAQDYQAGSFAPSEASWDYVHFRDILADALNEVFGKALYELLLMQRWFDRRLVSQEEIVDRCLSLYIMSECQYKIVSK